MSKSTAAGDLDLYSGLVHLLVLHGTDEAPLCSLHALLQDLEKKDSVDRPEARNGESRRRVYRATPLGKKALATGKVKIQELFRELNTR